MFLGFISKNHSSIINYFDVLIQDSPDLKINWYISRKLSCYVKHIIQTKDTSNFKIFHFSHKKCINITPPTFYFRF